MGRTKTKQSKSTSRSDSTSAPASSSLTLYAVVALTAVVVGVLFNAQIAHVLRQLSGTTAASLAPEKAEAAAPAAAPGTVLEVFEHDATAFTQGLFVHNGSLYESTGLYGASVIRRVDPATGAVLAQTPLDKSLFGEVRCAHDWLSASSDCRTDRQRPQRLFGFASVHSLVPVRLHVYVGQCGRR